jgi:hypothetical protein
MIKLSRKGEGGARKVSSPVRQRALKPSLRIVFWSLVCLGFIVGWFVMIRMPGQSFHGTAPALSAQEKELRNELLADVHKLAGEIGERNMARYPQLLAAADYIETELKKAGWNVSRDEYEVGGKRCANIVAELPGKSSEIVLIGAHYDSVFGAPGSDRHRRSCPCARSGSGPALH